MKTPIPFSAPMVRALLAGTKTQTRRIMKPQPSEDWSPYSWGEVHRMKDGEFVMRDDEPVVIGYGPSNQEGDEAHACPYGVPGDRLWVRETMRTYRCRTVFGRLQIRVRYEADGEISGWITIPARLLEKPRVRVAFVPGQCLAYGGFREAWRISLEITDVRVLRVQEISEEDTKAEGVERNVNGDGSWSPDNGWIDYANMAIGGDGFPAESARDSFRTLWQTINGADAWDANPYVWCLTFRMVTP